jgi:plastocyanin
MTRRLIATLALAALLTLAGCATGMDGDAGPDAAPAKGVTEVQMHRERFTPAAVEVPAGTTITWRFSDGSVPHNVAGDGFSSPTESTGTFTHRFDRPGTYDYRCTLHSGMRGRVIVQ